MQTSELIRDWIRWISVFFLVSLGIAMMTGLDVSQNDRSPALFFVGWWLSVVLFAVLPGVLLGGIIALATKRSKLGLLILGAVNAVASIALLYGSLI